MANIVSFAVRDFDEELSTITFNTDELTAANYTAYFEAINDFKANLQPLILGTIATITASVKFIESNAIPADQNAQVQRKFRVVIRDDDQYLDGLNTIQNVGYGKLFAIELPCANATLLNLLRHEEELPLDHPQAAPFIEAFQAVYVSPTGGRDSKVVSIRLVGRV